MTVSQISVENYRELVEPTLKKRHKEIYDLIKASMPEGIHSKAICEKLNKLPHQISGRFSEMVALELIIVDRTVKIKVGTDDKGQDKFSTYGVWILKPKGEVAP